ncbi:MAG: zinc ribbon domain-containing protein [Ruminococcaceae bacterium]|nr:zinc ribbon domain-containing protein [Oscillospiraceae bacterium]
MSNQKFCPNCGTANEMNAAFCSSCGNKFPEAAAPAQQMPTGFPAAAPTTFAPAGAIKQNANVFLFLPLICAVISAIAVFFLPWFEINFFVSVSLNLFEIVDKIGEELTIFLVAIILFLVMTIASSVLLIVKKKANNLGLVSNALLLLAALIFIIYVSAEGDGYVDIGFGAILTVIAGIGGVVASSVAKKNLA